MQFRKFIIENYRAVEYAEVPVANNLIPLVGVNESGKTSILQAILAFDRISDSYGAGQHLDFKNKYTLGEHPCKIHAEVVIDLESDLDKLSQKLRLTRGNELMEELEEAFRNKARLILTRDLTSKRYSIHGINVPDEKNEALANAVYGILPFLLYFDDFTERVPQSVEYVRTETAKGFRLRNPRLGEWNRILEEIFKRATDGEHTLESFVNMKDEDERRGLLSDINDVLNVEIIDAWRKLRKPGGGLADDHGVLSLHLGFTEGESDFHFEFKVTDRSTQKVRWFNVVDRSKGFQWFFNFQMKLKFNPKYQEVQSGAIYLLDEPGSYLHSSAQTELLQSLHDISETNTILYCTHSQHLLDPDFINISDTRIVHKVDGKISVVPFGNAKDPNYQGALTPLFNALHLKTGVFNRRIRYAVITEGITDYYLFDMLRTHRPEWRQIEMELIPGAGADQLKDLISMSIAFADRFCVLLDSDRAGVKARNTYIRQFGQHLKEQFFNYITPGKSSNVILEHFLSESDKRRLLDLTNSDDVKSGIIQLYYHDRRDDFWKDISFDTLENLSLAKEYLYKFTLGPDRGT